MFSYLHQIELDQLYYNVFMQLSKTVIAFYPGAGGNRYLRMQQQAEWKSHKMSYDHHVTNQSEKNRYINDASIAGSQSDVILSHCVNTTLIKKIWPNHQITVIIGDLQCCLRREWMLNGHQRYWQKITRGLSDKIDFYNAIKDQSWPVVYDEKDLASLPSRIQQEFSESYSQLMYNNTTSSQDIYTILTKEFMEKLESAYEQIQWHKQYYQSYPLDLDFCDQQIDLRDSNEFSSFMTKELSLYSSEVFDRCWSAIYD